MKIECTFCKCDKLNVKTQMFKNVTRHYRLEFNKCGRWIKYLNSKSEYLTILNLYEGAEHKEKPSKQMPLFNMEQNTTSVNSGQGNQTAQKTQMRTFSICLSDLPKEKINTAKNGKKYISLVMFDNEQPDQFGNDFAVQVSRTAEERTSGAKALYVGNGKIVGKEKTETVSDDLPF